MIHSFDGFVLNCNYMQIAENVLCVTLILICFSLVTILQKHNLFKEIRQSVNLRMCSSTLPTTFRRFDDFLFKFGILKILYLRILNAV